ncbi:MAG: VOC family protein [bacterium]|nr:VOC family protein [bacterium]
MKMKLEAIVLPVANVDMSLDFYKNTAGFHLDHDVRPRDGMRIVQLTPEDSDCSIIIGEGLDGLAAPGSIRGVHLVVENLEFTKKELMKKGLKIGNSFDAGSVKWAFFEDPDGNTWELQQIDKDAHL